MTSQEETQTADEQQWKMILASTRPVRLRGDNHVTQFTRSSLDDAAEQVHHNYVPLRVEHLSFMPPIGIMNTAEVQETEDGEAELCVSATSIKKRCLVGDELDIPQLYADLESAVIPEISVELEYDRRNFDNDTITDIQQDFGDIARPVERWSELPPLEYLISIPVVWGAAIPVVLGATKFAGAFFDELGRTAGKALSTKISSWTRNSKQPDRTIVFGLRFKLSNGAYVCGYVLPSPDNIEPSVDRMLKESEKLASIAGIQNEHNIFPSMKEAAFFFDEEWHLGWWTDGESIFYTSWFQENPPDIDGVLGR